MRRFLTTTWLRFCSLINVSRTNQNSLREKAILVAGRVTMVKDGNCVKVSCPVCLELIQASLESDLKMILAVHMSLWHAEDVNLQWQMMQNKKNSKSFPHVPSFVFGAGVASMIGVLISYLAKNRARALMDNRERQLVFKLK